MNCFRFCIAALFSVFFTSCCNDKAETDISQFSYYVTDTRIEYADPGIVDHRWVMKGYFPQGKLTSVKHVHLDTGYEEFLRDFEYEDGLLRFVTNGFSGEALFYDSQQRLTAFNLISDISTEDRYYKLVYISDSKVHLEELDAQYDDPAAVVTNRVIAEFDANDNLIKAGMDADFNGVADNQNVFTYTNNNLTLAQFHDGTTYTYDYGTVKDNFAYLHDATYGKKIRRLISAPDLASQHFDISTMSVWGAGLSQNVTLQESGLSVFTLINDNFYLKKEKMVTSPTQTEQVTATFH